MTQTRPTPYLLLAVTLVAFAGNSVLTRAALVDPMNAGASFAAVRLVSGAGMLVLLAVFSRSQVVPRRSDVPSVLALFAYALCFSLAYRAISAATGALILFALVQITMIGVAQMRGHRLSMMGGLGMLLAFVGLSWLLLPGLSAPPLGAALLMAAAGVSWGLYSLWGQGGGDPSGRTLRNFVGTTPLALALLLFLPIELTSAGWALAIASGAITSALGYMLWYRLLPSISVPLAASAQLSVPLITAVGGVLFLGEGLSLRLLGASVLILGGIFLTGRK
ncbi:DMT family transporter [Celeribacter litoreus]|uniref:DMT family transporter n=1 Tax=Celeribacter litoreus TaxID=2876714 RepID=UPI001CCB5848|nr:DMT family transporter [Celeribacter litoreus]MCA0042960.1 DMT family transporter [Celeribacter litoreus]